MNKLRDLIKEKSKEVEELNLKNSKIGQDLTGEQQRTKKWMRDYKAIKEERDGHFL